MDQLDSRKRKRDKKQLYNNEVLTIVGNKADKADFQQITYSEGKQFA